jgi:Flp pilus assembly protein TadG
VEFALVLPFLVTAFLGIFEIGRALLVRESLSNAAQRACRTGTLPGKTNADVVQDIHDSLTASGFSGYSSTIMINDVVGDVRTARRHDKISVKVSVPVAQVSWISQYFVKGSTVDSEVVVMVRQG